ncbi:MAG: HAMP domain-containing histidine kinase [Tannerellaceae bacterium]|nr:HAMP domain-containing histidine kinase [Tannerellaceae bacterium]
MEKQIKIVWILSLITAFTVIGIQGYWLWNQYKYTAVNYSEELYRQIIETGEEENKSRRQDKKISTSMQIQTNSSFNADSIIQATKDKVVNFNLPEGVPPITIHLQQNVPDDILYENLQKLVTNILTPPDTASFKAYFIQHLPLPDLDISFLTFPVSDTTLVTDEFTWHSSWRQTGSLWMPAIEVYYPYSPLERKAILITAKVPIPGLLEQMSIQFFVTLLLLFVFSACLIYQIKTILKQKQLSDYQKGFVNTMVHELKRPVQTLKMFVSFLQDKEMRSDEEASEQVIEDSMFELDNLSAYLEKLKDMIRADAGVSHIKTETLDMEQTIHKVVRLTHIPGNKKVEFDIAVDGGKTVSADPVHFANIISNLIENAIKYSGEIVNIAIRGCILPHGMRLSVADNGIGILPSDREKVFYKFYRGENHPGKDIPGLGLGLSYVKLITEAHHGEVKIDSLPGKGTTVTIEIPQ